MEDRISRAYNWAAFTALMACAFCLTVFLVVSAPGFNVLKDRHKVESILNPPVVMADATRAG